MDWGHLKELLWLCFWCETFSLIIVIVEKCVHFDIWNKNFWKKLGSIWLIFHLFSQIQIWKMSKIIWEPLEKVNNFLFQISKCMFTMHFSTIKMMGRNTWHQKQSHSSSLKYLQSILNTLYIFTNQEGQLVCVLTNHR